jgi:hypothetical protein
MSNAREDEDRTAVVVRAGLYVRVREEENGEDNGDGVVLWEDEPGV